MSVSTQTTRVRWHMFLGAVLLLGLASAALAQGNSLAAQVRNLNNELLRLHGQSLTASPNEQALLHSRAFAVSQQRVGALAALIAQDPSESLKLAFPPEVLLMLAETFPQIAGQLEAHAVWTGTLEYLIIDDLNLTVSRSVRRLRIGAEALDLHFAGPEPAGLKCGLILRVTGVRAGNRVAASQGSIVGSSVAPAACSTQGVQNSVVIMFTFPGVPAPNISAANMYLYFFDTNPALRSVNGFWQEASYGKTSAAGTVVGWYTLDRAYTCDEYNSMLDAALRAADAEVYFPSYSRIFLVFPPPAGCGWAGLGTLGCWSRSSPGDGSFTTSVSWLIANYMSGRDSAVKLATHEGGHNLGLHHARSRDFGTEALGPLGAQGTLSEYGDLFNTMGSWNLGHYSSRHKLQLGWFSTSLPVNIETVESTATRVLEPIETNVNGLHALKVRRGTGNEAWVWIEYRQQSGLYDGTLNSQVFGGALIHYQDSVTGSSYTDLLDFTTATSSFTDPALVAGQSWADPYSNLSISIPAGGATPTGLTVNVAYGSVPCVEANPTVTISPSNPSALPGETETYTVSVKNNDSVGCPGSTFNLSSSLPAGWSTTFGALQVQVAPGGTGSTTMTKTVPSGQAPGTYPVDATATDGSFSGAGTANCTVTAPPPKLEVTVGASSSIVFRGSTVAITATVTTDGAPRSGASVTFKMTKADGRTATKKATTGAGGSAVWNYTVGKRDPTGQYSVSATAKYGGQTVSSTTPATFEVK